MIARPLPARCAWWPDIIRGVEINKALGILRYSKKEASIRMEKLLKSAIANWEAKNESERLEDVKLCVKEVFVDGGRMLKRIQAAPQGRAHRIRKRSNHAQRSPVDKMVTVETSNQMGQKVNPIPNRLGIIRGWDSNWFGGKFFSDKLVEDAKIRKYLNVRLAKASISKIIIERTLKLVTVTISTARPGIIIGKGGQEVDKLKEELKKLTGKEIQINIFGETPPRWTLSSSAGASPASWRPRIVPAAP